MLAGTASNLFHLSKSDSCYCCSFTLLNDSEDRSKSNSYPLVQGSEYGTLKRDLIK